MAEAKPNPQRGQRALARYRFEYERKRTWTKAGLVVATGVCVIGAMIGVTLLRRPSEPPAVLAQAAPKVETPKPLAFVAVTPTPVAPPAEPPAALPAIPAASPPPPIARPERPEPVLVKAGPEPDAGPSPSPAPEMAAATPAAEVRLAATAPVLPPEPAVQAPADPCAGIGGAVARLVCTDPELQAADAALVAAFRRSRQLTDNPERLDRQQDRWRAQRDALGPNRGAVLAHYQQRYRQLWPPVRRVTPPIGAQHRAGFIPR